MLAYCKLQQLLSLHIQGWIELNNITQNNFSSIYFFEPQIIFSAANSHSDVCSNLMKYNSHLRAHDYCMVDVRAHLSVNSHALWCEHTMSEICSTDYIWIWILIQILKKYLSKYLDIYFLFSFYKDIDPFLYWPPTEGKMSSFSSLRFSMLNYHSIVLMNLWDSHLFETK